MKKIRALRAEDLPVKHFVSWVDWQVKLSINGNPPPLLVGVLKGKRLTHWQRIFINLKIEKWNEGRHYDPR